MLKSSVLSYQDPSVNLKVTSRIFSNTHCPSTIIFNVHEQDINSNCVFSVGVFFFLKQSKCQKSKQDCWSISKHQSLKQDDSRYFLLVNNLVRIETALGKKV